MARKRYVFVLKVRQHWRKNKRKVDEPQTLQVIATGKFEAELRYEDHHPKMVVLACERGAFADPPT